MDKKLHSEDVAAQVAATTVSEKASASKTSQPGLGALIMSAALALPGMQAHAETVPEKGEISLRFLHYADSQPDMDRIQVNAPSLSLLVPIAGAWTLEGSLVSDHVSGASSRFQTAVSGASQMNDTRNASDVRVSRYFANGKLSVGAAYSKEHDYVSRAYSIVGSISNDSKNTTWTFGTGTSNDDINPTNLVVKNETKKSWEVLAGVSQIITPVDIVQANLTYTQGRGYYSDPYKLPDFRPRNRKQTVLQAGWNHHFKSTEGTNRFTYRYYTDSWGINAHSLGTEYVQPLAQGWTVTPSIRYYTQSAAKFYYDAIPGGYVWGDIASFDPRLSAFGAFTFGIKAAKRIGKDWIADVKVENYEQRSNWRWLGKGSPGIAPFSAYIFQVGLTKEF